ncbi:MAG: PTS sugar transporter subunit IIC [Negativicutes bacterium]|nr:PTS sugar transporter subunit IIC [Negativicutes bacterium]
MDRLIIFMEEKMAPLAGWISEQPHLKAIRDAGLAIMPLLLVGSAFLIVANPPVESLAAAVAPYKGDLAEVVMATFGVMGLAMSVSLPYSLAKTYNLDAIAAGMISFSAFLIANPFTADGNINLGLMGGKGFFVAMIIGFFTVEMLRVFVRKNIVIRLPDGVPPTVSRSFAALIPAFCILTVVWLVNQLLEPWGHTLPTFIDEIVTKPLLILGGSFVSVLIAEFAIQVLWSFGIHGAMLVMGIGGPIWDVFTQANAMAKAAGHIPEYSITRQFFDVFVLTGGSGMTLPLALIMMIKARSAHLKMIGRTAIWPGLFNINEPITFGVPIVLNPVMVIPFIICPMLAATTTYFAMETGLVAKTYAAVPWTMPVFFSGFLSTGDWKAVILQLVNFVLCGMVYYPFIMTIDKQKLQEEGRA